MIPSKSQLTDLLVELRRIGVRLWLEGDSLHCDAPKGILSNDLREKLIANKAEVIALLKSTKRAPSAEWDSDSKLPEDIRPSHERRSHSAIPKNILLTGATGFLGTYLLREALCQTEAHVHCLVRPASVTPAGASSTDLAASQPKLSDRLRFALEQFGLWQSCFENRIIAIPGNLQRGRLGINASNYDQLTNCIDLVLHNGAEVHHGMPYSNLKSTNVFGVREAIRVACDAGAAFHYVSSLSVLPPIALAGPKRFFENDGLESVPPPSGGYDLTKWVGEHLATEAAKRGLEVTIYRPGPVTGDSRTGQSNRSDFLYRLVNGFVRSGMAPTGELVMDVLPVDFAAQSIVWLTVNGKKHQDPASNPDLDRFHLFHPHPKSSDVLFKACENAGISISRVSQEEWRNHLRQLAAAGQTDHPLYSLVPFFSTPSATSENQQLPKMLPYDASRAQFALSHAPFSAPDLTEELFRVYIDAMLASDLEAAAGGEHNE